MTNNLIKSKTNNIVVQELETEVLIYNLESNKAFCLNETSALIWQICGQENSLEQIRQKVEKRLNHPVMDEFIWLALSDLKKHGLIENANQVEDKFEGLNRRQIVKKVGLATMMALPAVSSVVAPTAANAQSGCSFFQESCVTREDCCAFSPGVPLGIPIFCRDGFCEECIFDGRACTIPSDCCGFPSGLSTCSSSVCLPI
jgi:hypothetical protein